MNEAPPLPRPPNRPRVLCIWLPNWPIQRIAQQRSASVPREEPTAESRGTLKSPARAPLVLSTRDPRRGQVVAAVSLAGRAAGIRPGMRLSEATALADVDLHEHDPHEDIDALCELAEQAQQFSPLVGLEQLDKKPWAGRWLLQPECLLLDVTGIAGLFGGEPQLLDAVARWLGEQRLFGCLGLAGTVGAAWALANYRTRSPTAPRIGQLSSLPDGVPACRIAIARPNIARPNESIGEAAAFAPETRDLAHDRAELDALAELPLAALRLPTETLVALQRLGLQRIEQLTQLPRAGMASRLGELLLLRWDQAAGRQAEPIITRHALPDWHLEQSLEIPTQHRETMVELVRRLTRQLAERLGRQGQGALRVVCRLDLVESPPLVMQLGLFRPNADAPHLEMLLIGQLDQQLPGRWAAAGAPPLWRLSLQATLTAPLLWRQTELFEAGETASRGQLARLVDTLSSRLGRKAVLSVSLQRESQPELACRLQPMTGRKPDGDAQQTVRKLSSRLARARGEPARDDPQRRPTQLFSPPLPIQVRCNAATDPSHFTWRGTWLEIIEAAGPERLESGWWRGPSARRDYFRVATSETGWWWIFRDMNTGQWFLHGAFD